MSRKTYFLIKHQRNALNVKIKRNEQVLPFSILQRVDNAVVI